MAGGFQEEVVKAFFLLKDYQLLVQGHGKANPSLLQGVSHLLVSNTVCVFSKNIQKNHFIFKKTHSDVQEWEYTRHIFLNMVADISKYNCYSIFMSDFKMPVLGENSFRKVFKKTCQAMFLARQKSQDGCIDP